MGWLWVATLAGCAGAHEGDVDLAGPPLSAAAFAQPLIELPLPPAESYGDLASLRQVSSGYAAFYRKAIGQGKESAGWEHRVFLSDDGVSWRLAGEPTTPTSVGYRTLAFGAGQYLLAGANGGLSGALMVSNDAVRWSEVETTLPAILKLEFLNGRFFALGQQSGVYTSADGVHFTGAATQALQLSAIAYGHGAYVAVGSGPIELSRDGASWDSVALDCAWADACVTPPGGEPVQGYRASVVFGGERFYAGRFSSEDGAHWEEIADLARVPDTYVLGWLLKRNASELSAWQDGAAAVLHTTVVTDNSEHLDCRSRRCLLLPNALLLVP